MGVASRTNAVVPVAEYVRKVPAALRPTMNAGRRTIKATAPKGTKETAYRVWPIRYSFEGEEVCGIGNYPRWVSVYFSAARSWTTATASSRDRAKGCAT